MSNHSKSENYRGDGGIHSQYMKLQRQIKHLQNKGTELWFENQQLQSENSFLKKELLKYEEQDAANKEATVLQKFFRFFTRD
jgi:regulator of replication initiation timing